MVEVDQFGTLLWLAGCFTCEATSLILISDPLLWRLALVLRELFIYPYHPSWHWRDTMIWSISVGVGWTILDRLPRSTSSEVMGSPTLDPKLSANKNA